MADLLVLDLVEKLLVTDQLVLTIGYDIENLMTTYNYGRQIPKHAHSTVKLNCPTSSTRIIVDATFGMVDRIVDKKLLVRRVSVMANRVVHESTVDTSPQMEQLDLLTDYAVLERK